MFTESFNVRFYELDGLQHVSNTVMVGWFETGRQPIFRIFNPTLNLQKWPVILANYKVDFLQQVYLDGEITIKTGISRIGNSSFEVYQECWQSGELKAKGTTTMVYFDYDENRSKALPDDIKQTLEQHLVEPK